MPTPFLALNTVNGTTPQAQYYVSGSNSPLGVTFGSIETAVGTYLQIGQRITRFGGYNTFIAVAGDAIYRSTDAGASWTSVHTHASITTSAGPCKAGPYVLYEAGTPYAVVLTKQVSSANHYVHSSADGITWSTFGPVAITEFGGYAPQSSVNWRGSIYTLAYATGSGSNQRLITWNRNSISAQNAQYIHTAVATQYGCLCVFNDRLFAVDIGAAGTGSRVLYEFVSGAWVVADAFQANTGAAPTNSVKWTLFVDPASDQLVAIVQGTSTTGWSCVSWDGALTRTDRTSSTAINSVLPTGNTTTRIASIVDVPETLGANASVYLYYAANGATTTPFTLLKWNGVSSPITSVGSGGNVMHALPLGVNNGGDPFWTSGQRHIERISAAPVDGGVRWGFKIYSPNPSTDTVSVRWLVGDAQEETTRTPYATLSNPSSGTLGAGNTQIDGLDAADNGTTTFYVTWLAPVDGFSNGDYAKTTPEIFT